MNILYDFINWFVFKKVQLPAEEYYVKQLNKSLLLGFICLLFKIIDFFTSSFEILIHSTISFLTLFFIRGFILIGKLTMNKLFEVISKILVFYYVIMFVASFTGFETVKSVLLNIYGITVVFFGIGIFPLKKAKLLIALIIGVFGILLGFYVLLFGDDLLYQIASIVFLILQLLLIHQFTRIAIEMIID